MKTTYIENEKINITEDSCIIDFWKIPNAEIFIEKNCKISYTLISPKSEVFRHIKISEGSELTGKWVIVEDGNTTLIAEAIGDNSYGKINLLAIAKTNANISVEGVARVENPYKNVFMRVDQTNILIGENTIVRGVPKIEIASDGVEGGHSCKIHRLHGDALFYLESHGLDPKHAESFLLNSEILTHLDWLPDEIREKNCSDIHKLLFVK